MANISKIVENAYTKKYLYEGNDFYIHQHIINIGRANKKNAETDDTLTTFFTQEKQHIAKATRKQYSNLFLGAMTGLDDDSIRFLNTASNMNDFIEQFSTDLGTQLEKSLPAQKLQSLMNIYKDIPNNMGALLKTEIKNDKAMENLNKILNALNEAMNLITNDFDDNLNLKLTLSEETTRNRKQLGRKLNAQLEAFKRKIQGTSFSDKKLNQIQQIQHVLPSIKSFLTHLETGHTNDGETLQPKSLVSDLVNVFSGSFAQAISSEINENCESQLFIAMDKIQSVLSGNETINLFFTDTKGNPISGRKPLDKAQGKADVRFQNVNVKYTYGGKDYTFTMQIGISDKFYKNVNFPIGGSGFNNNATFSLGSGSKFVDMLDMITTDNRYKYLAYNVISRDVHGDETGSVENAIRALQQAILVRSLVYMASSRGGVAGSSDFAQFLYVNGKIISVYELIDTAIKQVTMFSESEQEAGVGSSAVYFSLSGRTQAIESAKKRNMSTRVSETNSAIRKLALKGQFNASMIGKKI